LEHKPSSHKIINERREYFRVKDTVLLRYRPIDQTNALANIVPAQFNSKLNHSLVKELQNIESENGKYLRLIGEENRDLEAYLKGLNKKIDLIAGKLMDGEALLPDQEKQIVILSEGGLSFHCDNEIALDSYLALELILLPTHQSLILFGQVINSSPCDQGYDIAVNFVNLKEADRQHIAKHVMQLQLAMRRQQSNPE